MEKQQPYPPEYTQAPAQNPNVVVAQPAAAYTTTTTVVTQQPVGKTPWTTGLCDCFNDITSLLGVLCLGELYVGCIAQRMGEHYCVGCGLGGLWPMRSAFRERHHIEGDLCNDCCITTFCGFCSACQLSREMDRLGYPPGPCC